MSAENVTTYGNVADRLYEDLEQGYNFQDHHTHRSIQDMEM